MKENYKFHCEQLYILRERSTLLGIFFLNVWMKRREILIQQCSARFYECHSSVYTHLVKFHVQQLTALTWQLCVLRQQWGSLRDITRDAYHFGSMDAPLPALAGNSRIAVAIVYPHSGFMLLWDFRRRRKILCKQSNPGFSVYYRCSPFYII